MFVWTDESIYWYQTAARWTDYHARLIEELEEFLCEEDEVCDVGCGLGFLSVVASPLVKQVTSVDVEPKVLQILSDEIEKQGIQNITPINKNWKTLPANYCDTVLACSFGNMERDFFDFMRIARKRLILIRRGKSEGGLGFNSLWKYNHGAETYRKYLEDHNIPYRFKTFQADFGQPLTSPEEATRFVDYYCLKPEMQSMEEYLDVHMTQIDHEEYKYFFPNLKNTYIFVIEKGH
jgi:predicted RNA methylase